MGSGEFEGIAPGNPEGDFDSESFGVPAAEEISLGNHDGTLDPGNPDWPRCQVCDIQIPTWHPGKRGRKPRFCDDHKSGAPKSRASGGSATVSEKGLDAKLKRISADLAENVRLVGAVTSPALPVTGFIVLRDADQLASATVKLARNNPKILAALQRASQVGPGIAVGRFLATMGTAIAVDTQRIDPRAALPAFLGVTAVWEEILLKSGENPNVYEVPPPLVEFA